MPPTTPDPTTFSFDPKDQPLRADVGRLGAILGELLKQLAPEGIYELVEAARLASRRRRQGEADAGAELEGILRALSPTRAMEVVRGFSAYFGVVNTAEQVHRLRRGIDYRRSNTAQPGSLRASARELARRGTPIEEVLAALEQLVVEPVFTAHPTEAVRRTLLKKEQRLAQALVARFAEDVLDPAAVDVLDRSCALQIASAWQTEEQLPDRPTVAEEVEHVLFFLSEVLYSVVPSVHEELERALRAAYGREVSCPRPVVRFASWVGGDMDGNPNVGADTIRATLARHVELALRRYADELRELHEHLSQSTTRVEVDAEVLARVTSSEAGLVGAELAPPRFGQMPYRRLLWTMSERLNRKARGEDGGYGPPSELRADLQLIASSLERHGGDRAGLELVRRTLRRVDVFGFHLAKLDVRQGSEVHRRVAGRLLGDPDFAARETSARTERIARALSAASDASSSEGTTPSANPAISLNPSVIETAAREDAEVARTLDVFVALTEARADYGPEAVGPYIISMAEGPDDVLAVLLLARAAGCVTETGEVPLDIAPLFETVPDLEAGPEIFGALVAHPVYARHLSARGARQVVMLGYSDSGKDGGIAASRVALDRAQRKLAERAEAAGVALTLFHGRGGSISRGGSRPRDAILAAPRGAVGAHVRATEQGEVIGAKFGLRGIASRTLEVTLGALLERSAGGDRAVDPSEEQLAIAQTLGTASRATYRALVHEDPGFGAFFNSMTPIDVIERMEIGSRPARRHGAAGVNDLRAIPWVFSWTQCRALLPGWFGVGSGLLAASEAHGDEAVRRAVADWPFLGVLLNDVEMVLAKSDMEIATRYAEAAGVASSPLFAELREEHARTVAAVLQITGSSELLERDPTLQRAIHLRNPYIDPMSYLQIDLLGRWRAGGREDDELLRALRHTVRGIARGLRNTG